MTGVRMPARRSSRQTAKAVPAGQHEVQEDEVPARLLAPAEGGLAVADSLHLVAVALEVVLQPSAMSGSSSTTRTRGMPQSLAGRTIVNVLPEPGSLSTVTRPP